MEEGNKIPRIDMLKKDRWSYNQHEEFKGYMGKASGDR